VVLGLGTRSNDRAAHGACPEPTREKARQTFLSIDDRLGSYTRLKFMMIFAVGAVLSAGFYLVGLNYWLLAGGFVSLVEIVPVIGPLVGAIFVVAIASLPQSLHTAVLSLVVFVGVREFQSYVVNPHLMGRRVGLSPLVTLVSDRGAEQLFAVATAANDPLPKRARPRAVAASKR
jgi:predicted PurR-regulated permease PerM